MTKKTIQKQKKLKKSKKSKILPKIFFVINLFKIPFKNLKIRFFFKSKKKNHLLWTNERTNRQTEFLVSNIWWVSLTIHKKLSWANLQHIFWWKLPHGLYKRLGLWKKKIHTKNFTQKRDTSKTGFPENQTALTNFEKSPTQHHFLDGTLFFFPPNHWKANTPADQNTITFNKFSILGVICMWTKSTGVHCTKNGNFIYLSGQTWKILSEKQKARSNNLHLLKAVSVAVLKPKGGDPTYTKSGAIICSTLWQSNVHCILQGLLNCTWGMFSVDNLFMKSDLRWKPLSV